jgi:uncharacterized membrane protein YfcA
LEKWSWTDTRIMAIGALPGVALGAWFYSLVSADAIRIVIGLVAVLFVVWQPIRKHLRLGGKMPLWGGGLAGIATGFTSFVSHAGGPPAAVYMLSRGLDKTTYQASTVLLFWVVNIAKFVPYVFLGLFTWETIVIDVLIVPFALIGAWIGVRAHHLVPERIFFAVTYLFLTITGAKLIWDGVLAVS